MTLAMSGALHYYTYNIKTNAVSEFNFLDIQSGYDYTGYITSENGNRIYAAYYDADIDIYTVNENSISLLGKLIPIIDIYQNTSFYYSDSNCKEVSSNSGFSYLSQNSIFTARDETYLYLISSEGIVKVDKQNSVILTTIPHNIPVNFFQNINFSATDMPAPLPDNYGVVDGDFIYIPDTQSNEYVYKIHKKTGETVKLSLPKPYSKVTSINLDPNSNNTYTQSDSISWFFVYNNVLFYMYWDLGTTPTYNLYQVPGSFMFVDATTMKIKKEQDISLIGDGVNDYRFNLYGVAKIKNGIIVDYYKGVYPE